MVTLLALSGKLIGGFAGSKAIGFNIYESLAFGIGVMPRAGIELVMITIGRGIGIIGEEIFSAMVFMVIVSILVSPQALRAVIQAERKNKTGMTSREIRKINIQNQDRSKGVNFKTRF